MTESKRQLGEMMEMFEFSPQKELYTMHRGVEEKGDLIYDVTFIPPLSINKHFNKTKGHIHKGGEKELYIVLEGEAVFFMQKGNGIVEDCYAVHAEKGECVIIPSGYYHITINHSHDHVLKVANWQNKKVEWDYNLFEKFKGSCYYYKSIGGEPVWVKNKNYLEVPKLRFQDPLKEIPKDLTFLL